MTVISSLRNAWNPDPEFPANRRAQTGPPAGSGCSQPGSGSAEICSLNQTQFCNTEQGAELDPAPKRKCVCQQNRTKTRFCD